MSSNPMAEFMRGASMPRHRLDVAALEARLGAPLGPAFVGFLELAYKRAPFEPWNAFAALDMHLVVLTDTTQRLPWMPEGVLPFLETGVDLHAAGFVDRGDGRPLDERPIWLAGERPCVVATDLPSFLDLCAVAGAEPLASGADAGERVALRLQRLDDAAFAEASAALTSLTSSRSPKTT